MAWLMMAGKSIVLALSIAHRLNQLLATVPDAPLLSYAASVRPGSNDSIPRDA
ncbi:hypothetical protein [Planococcus sp. CP5-4_UN]|uniref:hypothetical protein n=1 Tax=Planococcus sp. CP5-4_UN TaxID=2850852 RepID=UPI001C2C4902|nr:hypothetical protein [Planococcus sp. CP5-4_UN]